MSSATSLNILAFSDLHCDISAARSIVAATTRADVVVGGGTEIINLGPVLNWFTLQLSAALQLAEQLQ